MIADERVFTPPEVARKANQHPSTPWRAIQRGELPAFRVGSVYYITESDACTYIQRCFAKRAPTDCGSVVERRA
jgi:hypothetical protein